MTASSLKAVIEACDRAISQEDYATLMEYYADGRYPGGQTGHGS
ncbi:Uncharacterised protein [Kluyvera intermedia]|nr:Uncharacterised protein [Kluyvera intermedia]